MFPSSRKICALHTQCDSYVLDSRSGRPRILRPLLLSDLQFLDQLAKLFIGLTVVNSVNQAIAEDLLLHALHLPLALIGQHVLANLGPGLGQLRPACDALHCCSCSWRGVDETLLLAAAKLVCRAVTTVEAAKAGRQHWRAWVLTIRLRRTVVPWLLTLVIRHQCTQPVCDHGFSRGARRALQGRKFGLYRVAYTRPNALSGTERRAVAGCWPGLHWGWDSGRCLSRGMGGGEDVQVLHC